MWYFGGAEESSLKRETNPEPLITWTILILSISLYQHTLDAVVIVSTLIPFSESNFAGLSQVTFRAWRGCKYIIGIGTRLTREKFSNIFSNMDCYPFLLVAQSKEKEDFTLHCFTRSFDYCRPHSCSCCYVENMDNINSKTLTETLHLP